MFVKEMRAMKYRNNDKIPLFWVVFHLTGTLFMVAGMGSIATLFGYGVYLAFRADILLGIVSLLVEPAPLLFAITKFFWDIDLPVKIMEYLGHLR